MKGRLSGVLGLLGLGACASTTLGGKDQQHPVLITTPVPAGERSAEERTRTPLAASTPTELAPPPNRGVPDPQALATPEQWEFEVRLSDGHAQIVRATRRVFDRPVVTPRHVGRFAIELWIGRELIDRVRFDFPLLAGELPQGERQGLREAPRFEPGLDATRTILVPDSRRATRAQLVDRKTGQAEPIPWPPDAPLDPIALPAPTSSPGSAAEQNPE